MPYFFHDYCCYYIGGGGLVTKLYLTLVTPWTIAHQAPLSMGFSRQEYWGGLPLPSPEHLPNPGIKPVSPAWQADSLPLSHLGSPLLSINLVFFFFFFLKAVVYFGLQDQWYVGFSFHLPHLYLAFFFNGTLNFRISSIHNSPFLSLCTSGPGNFTY